jgi:hypothetical protein
LFLTAVELQQAWDYNRLELTQISSRSLSSISSATSAASIQSFVHKLNLDALASPATHVRSGHLAYVIDALPEIGAFNVVYFFEFTDGVRWVTRTPIAPWSEALK